MDHPVLLRRPVAADRKQSVASAQALAPEGDLDLPRLPLVQLVGPSVPDPHRAGAVLPARDVTFEVEVLERVILGVHGEAILVRVWRNPVGDRPGGEDPVVLQTQVPVQPRGVVLLDDEPAACVSPLVALGTRRLGGGLEISLGAIGLQLLGHDVDCRASAAPTPR